MILQTSFVTFAENGNSRHAHEKENDQKTDSRRTANRFHRSRGLLRQGAIRRQLASPSSASLEKFTASVRKVDGQAESHYKMALYFQKNRRNKLALEELKRAVESNPGMAKAHNAMGVSYDNLRQYDDAIRCYHAALKIDPELDYAHNNLGYSQLLRGNNEKAIKAFKHAIRLNGENKRYRNNLALAYVMDEQYDLAAEQFKIIDDESDSEQKLARLMYDLGKAKARQYLKKLSGERTRIIPVPWSRKTNPQNPTLSGKK